MAIYCSNCGKAMGDDARFCSACGAQMGSTAPGTAPGSTPYAQTRMFRPRTGRMMAGVCQGLAVTYHWDVVWVRVLTVLLTIFSSGAAAIAYIIFWIVMPDEPYPLLPPGAPYTPAGGN